MWPRLTLERGQTAVVVAVLLSIAVHVLVLAGPGWQRDEFLVPPVPLYARLLEAPKAEPAQQPGTLASIAPEAPVAAKPAPAPVAAQSQLPALEPEELAKPTSPKPAEAAAEPASSAPLAELQQSQPAPSASPADAPSLAEMASQGGSFSENEFKLSVRQLDEWAGEGCVDFAVTVKSLELGQARHCWQHDSQRYRATFEASAQILFRRFSIDQESLGRVVAGVPVSDVFRDKWDGKYFETLFQHGAGRVVQNRNGEVRELPTGGAALDILALMHFMARQNEVVEPFDMFVVANRGNVSRVTVVQQVPATLAVPAGKLIAQQYHVETRGGELKIDIWVGLTAGNAPVRLRIDNNGDVFDFRARHVELDGQVRLTAPEPDPPMPSQE